MSTALLDVDTTRIELPHRLLNEPGGFAWWYVDWWDADQNGAVFIWSFGLPFLPGHVGSSRRGHPLLAGSRPSLNVVLYRAGRPSFYLLQEYPQADADWSGDTVRLGSSRLRTRRVRDVRAVDLDIDCEIPGSKHRLTGTFRARGPAVRHRQEPERSDGHLWTPLLAGCDGELSLKVGCEAVADGSGRVYHDRNGSPRSIETLGIERWLWGRVALPQGERIWYLLWGHDGRLEAHVIDVDRDGMATRFPDVRVQLASMRRARYGLRYPSVVELWSGQKRVLVAQHTEVVDDGPFYLRMHTRAVTGDGAAGQGSGEMLVPDRIDVEWQRPLVGMAVHHTARPNSMWLPLFSGPRRGRWKRLLGVQS